MLTSEASRFGGISDEMKKSNIVLVILILALLLVAGCATQPAPIKDASGFFVGLWHGISAPVNVIVSIFTDIRFYESPNAGLRYDLGFMLGISFWGGSGAAACRRR